MELIIKEIIGSEIASDNEQGDLVFNKIIPCVDRNEKILLNFADLKLITTAFLNNAIGKLYKNYKKEELSSLLKVKNVKDKNDLELLRLVILNAIEMS